MIIWLSLMIPMLTAGVLLTFFSRKITWWELLVPLAVSFLLTILMKEIVQASLTSDTEYWTGWTTSAEYREKWTEEYDTTEVTTDSKGKVHTRTVHHVDHHPPTWTMFGSNNETVDIEPQYYKNLCKLWGNNTKTNLYHSDQTSWSDGNMYSTQWNNQESTMVVLTTDHRYNNKVQASRSLFKFRDFTKEEASKLGLFDYPSVDPPDNVPSILGDGGPTGYAANKLLCIRNAQLGKSKQVRMWILMFQNPDQQVAIDQESYWAGGNKNEFVLCIGTDRNYNVLWTYPFSWCEDESLKIDVRQHVGGQKKLDLGDAVSYMSSQVGTRFTRKHFRDFQYLTVEPPLWSVMTTYIITLVINIGLCFWFVIADFAAQDTSEQALENWVEHVKYHVQGGYNHLMKGRK